MNPEEFAKDEPTYDSVMMEEEDGGFHYLIYNFTTYSLWVTTTFVPVTSPNNNLPLVPSGYPINKKLELE